ncbi:MAG: RNA-binding S4 domain-containing protein [Rhodobacteraceae bacterium]|jgi:ribosome-associated heat shock protein Hsp15|nr:RNA-binding S4 domain-containing protein [Paracoccaceae bacterium]MBL4558862.1 RNA-binding S4 domain-containing protein [Paracoccaceae bacterium]HBG99981.1 RNA-binding protein [Paracoccaceae bacterium]
MAGDRNECCSLRADLWLWRARFFKSRALAAAMVGKGRLRRNGQRVTRPAAAVRPGDILTFPQAGRVRLVRIAGLGQRRGPAAEAAALYVDLDIDTAARPGDPAARPAPPRNAD